MLALRRPLDGTSPFDIDYGKDPKDLAPQTQYDQNVGLPPATVADPTNPSQNQPNPTPRRGTLEVKVLRHPPLDLEGQIQRLHLLKQSGYIPASGQAQVDTLIRSLEAQLESQKAREAINSQIQSLRQLEQSDSLAPNAREQVRELMQLLYDQIPATTQAGAEKPRTTPPISSGPVALPPTIPPKPSSARVVEMPLQPRIVTLREEVVTALPPAEKPADIAPVPGPPTTLPPPGANVMVPANVALPAPEPTQSYLDKLRGEVEGRLTEVMKDIVDLHARGKKIDSDRKTYEALDAALKADRKAATSKDQTKSELSAMSDALADTFKADRNKPLDLKPALPGREPAKASVSEYIAGTANQVADTLKELSRQSEIIAQQQARAGPTSSACGPCSCRWSAVRNKPSSACPRWGSRSRKSAQWPSTARLAKVMLPSRGRPRPRRPTRCSTS